MTPRERWLACLKGERPDRVPTDYWATEEVTARLLRELNLPGQEALYRRLGIDRPAIVVPRYVGPPLQKGESHWGWRTAPIQYATGVYWEVSHRPLAALDTLEELERHRWPSLDWWDFSNVARDCRKFPDRIVIAGHMSPLYYYSNLRGIEKALEDLLERPEYAERILQHLCEFHCAFLTRLFESAQGGIGVFYIGDDFGMQEGLLISPALFRRFFKPWMRRLIELAHSAGVYVMHHDDGAIRTLLPEFIEIGVDLLNPIQWRCKGMERAELARDFGARLVFHGAVDNQQTLPFGTPEDVRREVFENIELFACCKGYIAAPCHNIQPITPTANVLALYEAAHAYGPPPRAAAAALERKTP